MIQREDMIDSSKEILGGTPVFKGTRVPVRSLIEYLAAGDTLDVFLEDFPTVSRKQAQQFLELTKQELLDRPNEIAA